MASIEAKNNPALTATLDEFSSMKDQDELTYRNLSILRFEFGIEIPEDNLIDYYMEELKKICTKADAITFDDIVKYKYAPDMLSYDLYGTTQLDWLIMLCNGVIDPKEFDLRGKILYAPKRTVVKKFLSRVYNSEGEWLDTNRSELKDKKIEAANREDEF